jgi:hypothetical protein
MIVGQKIMGGCRSSSSHKLEATMMDAEQPNYYYSVLPRSRHYDDDKQTVSAAYFVEGITVAVAMWTMKGDEEAPLPVIQDRYFVLHR